MEHFRDDDATLKVASVKANGWDGAREVCGVHYERTTVSGFPELTVAP